MPTLLLLRGPPGAGKSTVAELIADSRSDVKVVEVDQIKLERYGTTERCDPASDFPEAGRLARSELDRGFHVVAVEFFNDWEHIDLFLRSLGSPAGVNLRYVWLSCDGTTAATRKSAQLRERVVQEQHARIAGRFRPNDELEIDSSARDAIDIATAVAELI